GLTWRVRRAEGDRGFVRAPLAPWEGREIKRASGGALKRGFGLAFLGPQVYKPRRKRPIMATALETVVASVIMPDREGRFSISLRDGRIAEIEPGRHDGSSRAWLALPGFANLHAHADRTFTVTSFRPRSFADALAASAKARAAFTSADV